MAADVADYTQQVNIVGGTVSISGTATVSIVGTPTVQVAGTPTVNIGNTPSVTIASGTVSISGTPSINIQSQSVNLNTQQPQTSLGAFTVPNAGTNNATYNVPAGTHVIAVLVDTGNGGLNSLAVQGVQSGVNYISLSAPAFVGSGGQLIGLFMSPVLSALDTQVKVTGTCSATGVPIGPTVVRSVAILDSQGVFVYNNTGEPTALFLTDQQGNLLGTNQYQNGLLNSPAGGVGGPIVKGLPVVVAAPNARTGYTATSFSPANNTPTQILASNTARRLVTLYVTGSGGTGYFVYGNATITAGSGSNAFVKIPDGGYFELPRMPDIYSDKLSIQSTDLASGGLAVVEWS